MPLPQDSCTAGRMPNKVLPTLGTTGPAGTTAEVAKSEAMGRVGMDGKISFAVDAAKTVKGWVWSLKASKWFELPTVAAGANQLRFIDAPAKALFFLTVDATTAGGWAYSDEVP